MNSSYLDQEKRQLNRHRHYMLHRNVKLYHHDYNELSADEIVPAIESSVNAIVERAEENLCIIIDLRRVKLDHRALTAFRQTSALSKPYIKKIAVVGIYEIQMAFLNYISDLIGLQIRAFDTIEQASDWLTE
jgi:adenosine deaminase